MDIKSEIDKKPAFFSPLSLEYISRNLFTQIYFIYFSRHNFCFSIDNRLLLIKKIIATP